MKITDLFNAIEIQNNSRPTNGASAIFEGTKSYTQHALNDMVEDHLPENTRVWKIQWVMSEDGNDDYRPQFIFARTKDEAAHKFTERMRHPSLGLVAIESIIEVPFDSLNEGEVVQFPAPAQRMSDRAKYDIAAELQRIDRESEWRSTDLTIDADPTKEEMQHVIAKSLGGAETDKLSYNIQMQYVETAIYWFATDFHSGQDSNLYSALSTSRYNPDPMIDKVEDEDEIVQEMFFTLYDYFSNIGEGKKLKNRKQPKDAAGAWNKAEKYTKYDPPKTRNKGVSARRGFVGG